MLFARTHHLHSGRITDRRQRVAIVAGVALTALGSRPVLQKKAGDVLHGRHGVDNHLLLGRGLPMGDKRLLTRVGDKRQWARHGLGAGLGAGGHTSPPDAVEQGEQEPAPQVNHEGVQEAGQAPARAGTDRLRAGIRGVHNTTRAHRHGDEALQPRLEVVGVQPEDELVHKQHELDPAQRHKNDAVQDHEPNSVRNAHNEHATSGDGHTQQEQRVRKRSGHDAAKPRRSGAHAGAAPPGLRKESQVGSLLASQSTGPGGSTRSAGPATALADADEADDVDLGGAGREHSSERMCGAGLKYVYRFYLNDTGNAHNTTPNTTDNTSHTHGTTTASAEQTTASATPSLNWSVRCRSSRPAASAASSAVKKALKLFSSASSFAK